MRWGFTLKKIGHHRDIQGPSAMIKVKVYDVGHTYPVNYSVNPSPLLWLTDEAEERVLVLTIGPSEAVAIKMKLASEPSSFPRPMTHDLLKTVFEQLDASVNRIVITELREGEFYVAEIHVNRESDAVVLDARPSDAIALALRTDAPIFVAEEVMEEHGQPMPKEAATSPEGLIEEHLESIQDGSTMSVTEGEDPETTESPLDTARRELQSAIDDERYEDAARLRDEIRNLEG
jgi:uncharacterized protein